ncbi:helix-turn-helix domain-containing protein [uncultured Algimonas sp.]|uniref:helix-turn-helix domain-containing protein n=1 Tax=uncultured Algimonas sp. TaxID=1547920 RepID=UPI00262836FA|nr:helix-turn-helix domain-containing protein [uncultured Algimonas sp.]
MARKREINPLDPACARLATAAVALEFGVPELALSRPGTRSPLCDFARQAAMYLTYCSYDMNKARVGELFGRHSSTVRHAIEVIEESRTDPVLDEQLHRLERWLGQAVRP